jgi:hypothetical protein
LIFMQDEQNQNQFNNGGIDPTQGGFSVDPNQGFSNPQPQVDPASTHPYNDPQAFGDQGFANPQPQLDPAGQGFGDQGGFAAPNPQMDPANTNPADYSTGAAYDTTQQFDVSGQAPQETFDQPQSDFGNEFSSVDQASAFDVNQLGGQDNFNPSEYQPFDQPQADTSAVPPLDQGQPFPQDAAGATPNTFQQKKTGSKIFLYGSIAVVVLLLIAMGVLSYFNFFAPDNTTNTDDTTAVVDDQAAEDEQNDPVDEEEDDEEEVIVDDGSTGGNNTPASQSRVNSDTEIPREWILQRFSTSETDLDGNCLNVTVCGNQADPDNDGANNLTEYNFGLDPLEADTDRDLVADGDELFVYFSNPSEELSDDDNFGDGSEISNCYDPINVSTSKMTNQRRSQIASNVTLRPLHEPTISLLQDAGATQSDIINRAVPLANCPTEDVSTDSTDTTDTDATDTTDTTDTTTVDPNSI